MNLVNMIERRMNYINEEVKVAAENLANKHTPGYKARRLTPLSFKQVEKTGFAVTQPGHIPLKRGSAHFISREKTGGFESLTENTVSHEEEMRRANEANLTHRQMTNLIQAHIQMLELVLKK